MSRKLSEAKKKMIAGSQHYKCANKPESNLIGLKNYKCPLYFHNDPILKGSFDQSGYEIDHITLSLSGQVMLEAVLPSITEHCIDQNDDMDNLQALCKMCHSVKTKKFLMNRHNTRNNSNNNMEKLHSLFAYINNEYIKTQTDIDLKFSDFYDNYIEYLKIAKLEPISKIAVSKLMENNKITIVDGNSNVRYIKITAKELYDIYNAKHWIHDVGDIHNYSSPSIKNLHSLFEYIKDGYIKTQTDIDLKFSDFYDNYTEYLKIAKMEPISKIAVSKLIKNNKITIVDGNSNVRYIKITAKELYDIYNAKHWIHDVDDIPNYSTPSI
jgi:pyruvate-formate lyase-activating enzyme